MAWVDGETNWYTITAFRQLALNVASSVSKGDRIIVSGKLRVRDWDNGERSGTSVEIEAETMGHDLVWGTTTFARTTLVREYSSDEEEIVIETA
jgi:single-strand DNA-binding protein